MELIIINVFVLGFIALCVMLYLFIYKPLQALLKENQDLSKLIEKNRTDVFAIEKAVQSVEKRIDGIFVVEPNAPATPNEATKKIDEGIEFSEDTLLDLPNNIKFEVEGGDVSIPPQYS